MEMIKRYLSNMLFFVRNYSTSNHKLVKTAFRVPNDPEGNYFIYLIGKYLNRDMFNYRARGRCSDSKKLKKKLKKEGRRYNKQSIPKQDADWLAVYLDHKEDAINSWRLYNMIRDMKTEINKAEISINDKKILIDLRKKLKEIAAKG